MSKQAIFVLNGSFNPITKAHIELLEKAYEYGVDTMGLSVTKLIISPVHEKYPYKKVKPSQQRVDMIKLAISNSKYQNLFEINYQEVDNEEGFLPTYKIMQNLKLQYSSQQIYLVCGADLIIGMANPDYWPQYNVQQLFKSIYTLTFLRGDEQTALNETISNSLLNQYKHQIVIVQQKISNASSTAVRAGDITYLYDNVAQYIKDNSILW